MTIDTKTAQVQRIETVYLPVTDPALSAQWYIENLQLELLRPVDSENNQAQLGLASGQALFLIRTSEPLNLTFKEVGGHEQCIMTLEVTDLQAIYQKLKSNDCRLTPIEDYGECGVSFSVYDPDGNKLEVWCPKSA